jgi:hypothetical protein
MGNQMFSLSSSLPTRFFQAGGSVNQVFSGWGFSQSGFFTLDVQPIRFQGAGSSANQVLRGSKFNQSGVEGPGVPPIRFQGARI